MTLGFQAPEILQAKGESAASDIYSLGVVFYQMLYGVLPFAGETEKEVLKMIKGKDYN